MIILDTNYLLRFFTKDIEQESLKARKIIKSLRKIYIPSIVFAETTYFLNKHYRIEKKDIIEKFLGLIRQPNIFKESFVQLAFEIYLDEHISFYDCLIIAEAIEKKGEIKSFDKRLLKVWKRRK